MNSTSRLREIFGRFATGVTVVTTRRRADDWVAVTVNSFTSVSLDPPLMLFGLAKASNCQTAFAGCDRFAVSILRHDQQQISTNFARPSLSRWDEVRRVQTPEGDLLIGNAAATFQCRRYANHEAGDHVLIVGLIERFSGGEPVRPLVFYRGGYGSFCADQSRALPANTQGDGQGDWTLGWG